MLDIGTARLRQSITVLNVWRALPTGSRGTRHIAIGVVLQPSDTFYF